MKNFGYLTCAALLAFASCTNEINEEGFVDKANTISFSAYPNKTRAVSGDVTSDNMKGDNFGVVGYYGSSIYLYKTESETNKAVEQYWKSSGSNNDGTWEYKTSSDLKFWPDGSMDFYAYFPYSDGATFAASNASGTVMTIPSVNCKHDILFAKHSTTYQDRVPLTFYHAFSKIQGLNIKVNGGNVADANVQVIVSNIEFINTATSGDVQVDKEGKATYKIADTNVPLTKSFTSAQTINKSATNGIDLITSNDNCYLFATNGSESNNVTGTNKTMWNGTNSSWGESDKLSTKGLVCLKLTCKVYDTHGSSKHYLVGSETENDYGTVYIPLTGIHNGTTTNLSAFEPGKRYTFNIVFTHNVGFKDNGDAILKPILFKVESVKSWEDVNVTITL